MTQKAILVSWASNLLVVHFLKVEGAWDHYIIGIEGFGRFIPAKTDNPNWKERDSCASGSPAW